MASRACWISSKARLPLADSFPISAIWLVADCAPIALPVLQTPVETTAASSAVLYFMPGLNILHLL